MMTTPKHWDTSFFVVETLVRIKELREALEMFDDQNACITGFPDDCQRLYDLERRFANRLHELEQQAKEEE